MLILKNSPSKQTVGSERKLDAVCSASVYHHYFPVYRHYCNLTWRWQKTHQSKRFTKNKNNLMTFKILFKAHSLKASPDQTCHARVGLIDQWLVSLTWSDLNEQADFRLLVKTQHTTCKDTSTVKLAKTIRWRIATTFLFIKYDFAHK